MSLSKRNFIHETQFLRSDQVEKLFSFVTANHLAEVKFSKFITIHMNMIDPRLAQEVVTKVMGYTRKWLKRNNHPHAHVCGQPPLLSP